METVSKTLQDERNKNLFLLFSILFHNLIYPLSLGDGIQPVLFYMVFSSQFVIAVFLLTDHRPSRLVVMLSGIGTFIFGVINSYIPSLWSALGLYLTGIVYLFTILLVLVGYIFLARRILIEVILAATSLYLVLGFFFTPIYGLIELLEPNSFSVSSGAAVDWQHLFYFSYATLTTLGYGDITPVKYYAQAVAVFEAVTGVLYTVVLLARLVSVYEGEKGDN